jgi:hypothetical protein
MVVTGSSETFAENLAKHRVVMAEDTVTFLLPSGYRIKFYYTCLAKFLIEYRPSSNLPSFGYRLLFMNGSHTHTHTHTYIYIYIYIYIDVKVECIKDSEAPTVCPPFYKVLT